MLEIEGTVYCDISIAGSDDSRLTSTSFVVKVEAGACSDEDISEDEHFDVLQELIEECEQATKAANDAVAKISGLALKNWEHIATITVAPNENGELPQKVIFEVDSDGNPFELTDFYIFMYAGFTDADSTLYVQVNNESVIANCSNVKHTTLRYNSLHYRQMPDGYIAVSVTQSAAGPAKYNAQSPIGYNNLISPVFERYSNFTNVQKILLYTSLGTNKTWLEGSTFELYGVRK